MIIRLPILLLISIVFATPVHLLAFSDQLQLETSENTPRLAGQATPLGEPSRWVSQPDYPYDFCYGASPRSSSRWSEGLCDNPPVGIVELQLFVAPSGRVVGCMITRSANDRRLDYEVCRQTRRRARFHTTDNTAESAAVEVYQHSVDWSEEQFHRRRQRYYNPSPLLSVTPPPPPYEAIPHGNPDRWVTTADYPQDAIDAELEGRTEYRVEVGVNGRTTDCTILVSSGHELLDLATCRQLGRRARFSPATNDAGEAISGQYENAVDWVLPAYPHIIEEPFEPTVPCTDAPCSQDG